MTSPSVYCHKCCKFVDRFSPNRRICVKCLKDEYKEYYQKNKQAISERYVKTGNKRGRPIKT